MMMQLFCGDCLEFLPTLADNSVDAVVTDPPYPCIKRDYGMMTEAEWWDMMMVVCKETRRILKPTGSAVFILQPNSKHVGQMRGWLWEFMAWVCREWNMVQDVWWWNITHQPTKHSNGSVGLMRPSLKACVWAGDESCYRNQNEVLWNESVGNTAVRLSERATRKYNPSGGIMDKRRCSRASVERGGVTPFNVLPLPNSNSSTSAGALGHNAGTPMALTDWWVKYICPPNGVVADWFMGIGTTGMSAISKGRQFVGIEKEKGYFAIAESQILSASKHDSRPSALAFSSNLTSSLASCLVEAK